MSSLVIMWSSVRRIGELKPVMVTGGWLTAQRLLFSEM